MTARKRVRKPKPNGWSRTHELAFVAALMADELRYRNTKLGDSVLEHLDAVYAMAVAFEKKFPAATDWDGHMSRGGACWDDEVIFFMRAYLRTHNVPRGKW